MGLYFDILPRIQEANTYGGGSWTFLFRKKIFETIDLGADNGDETLKALRTDIQQRAKSWVNFEDFNACSGLFETYCEATFYLASSKRISLEGIPRGPSSTPDFQTVKIPKVRFEIKTLDIVDPMLGYPQRMVQGLESNIDAAERAKNRGIGFGEQTIEPHGSAKTWSEVMKQTMRKLGGNVKKGQYVEAPTFLVANLGRLSVHVDAQQLNMKLQIPGADTLLDEPADISGHLWTIANHKPGEAFSWIDPDGRVKSELLMQAGLLRDYPFLQGIIFTTEPWSEFEDKRDWRDAYPFLGIWNQNCETMYDPLAVKVARNAIDKLCSQVVNAQ